MPRSSSAFRVTNVDDSWPAELAVSAVSGLMDAVELTPKPALIDRRVGEGSRIELARVRRCILTLHDAFVEIAVAAASAPRPSASLREELGRVGRDIERRMPTAPDGGPTWRGAIWALGLLVASAARRRADRRAVSIAAGASALAAMPDRFAPDVLTNGDRARLRFGAAGARGEAQAAFPHVIRIGLPALRERRTQGIVEEAARLDALLAIMGSLEDTSLLHRGGRPALDTARAGARGVLDAGGTTTTTGLELLRQLDVTLRRLRVSPRGSASLLSATLFLDRIAG
jgi:triphosphoribosyl-dephospho-CoA synthase